MTTGPKDWQTKNQGKAQEGFSKAQSVQPKASPGAGSKVSQSKPEYKPKPPKMGGMAADRSAHNERVAAESKTASNRLEKARNANNAVNSRKQTQNSVQLNKGKTGDGKQK